MGFSSSITIDNAYRVITSVPRGSRAWQKANSVLCQVGPEPTRAYFLLLRKDVQAMAANSAHSVQWKIYNAETGILTKALSFAGLYLTDAKRLLPGGPADPSAVYLCEFSDARAICKNASAASVVAWSGSSSWTSLLTSLWNDCALLGAWPGLPYTPDGVPENPRFNGENAFDALNARLELLDCAIRHNPFTGAFTIVQLGGSQTIPAETSSLKWNGDQKDTVVTEVAASVKVTFNNGPGTSVTTATGVSGSSGTAVLFDDLSVDSGTAARAAARTSRYALRYNVARQHRIHIGLLDTILPGQKVKSVLWRNWDDGKENNLGGTVTEFVSGPIDNKPVPDPPAWGWGRLNENLAALGSASCRVWQDVAGTMTDTGVDITVYDKLGQSLPTNSIVRWVLDRTTGRDYVANGSGKIVRFRLNATLSNGGSATARILTFDGAAYNAGSTDIYVFDWWSVATGVSTRGMFQGVSGMEGLAIPRESPSVSGHDEYDIVWMEQYAWDCEVTLTTNPTFSGTAYASGWSATATVDKSFHQGVSPGATITIHDDQNMYPFAKSGALAKVIRSEYEGSQPYYKVLVSQQLALTARANLSGAMCASTTALVAGVTVTSPSPFNLVPTVTYVNNPRGHAGEHGDEVWLEFNKGDASYEIVDMELKGIQIITSLRRSGAYLQAAFNTAYVERCDTTGGWLTIMAMNEFNWWCSGSYYQYCSGSVSSGSGSGVTGGLCDCTTLPSTLTLTIVNSLASCWNGQTVTLTKSGSTWSWSGTILGDSWAFSYACSAPGDGSLGGVLTVTYPACLNSTTPASPAALTALGASSCNPPHIAFGAINFVGNTGCAGCSDTTAGSHLDFYITA